MKLTRPQRELIYLLGHGWTPKMQHRWMSYWALRDRGFVEYDVCALSQARLTEKGRRAFEEIKHETAHEQRVRRL